MSSSLGTHRATWRECRRGAPSHGPAGGATPACYPLPATPRWEGSPGNDVPQPLCLQGSGLSWRWTNPPQGWRRDLGTSGSLHQGSRDLCTQRLLCEHTSVTPGVGCPACDAFIPPSLESSACEGVRCLWGSSSWWRPLGRDSHPAVLRWVSTAGHPASGRAVLLFQVTRRRASARDFGAHDCIWVLSSLQSRPQVSTSLKVMKHKRELDDFSPAGLSPFLVPQ